MAAPRDAVARLLADVVTRLVVDGRRLLGVYNERVERERDPVVVAYRARAAAAAAVGCEGDIHGISTYTSSEPRQLAMCSHVEHLLSC